MASRYARVGVPSPAEERASSASAQASALESLRTNHPELFVRVSPEDPSVLCLNTRFGVDVTEDNLLSVVLRPHTKRICASLAPNGRKESPTAFMYYIVKDALNMLDIDIDDLAKIGVVFGCNHECTDETYIHGYISYLRAALGNLGKLKTRARKAAERVANAEADRRMAESLAASNVRAAERAAARREEARRNREYERILQAERNAAARATRNAKLAAHGKLPVAEGDLLGIDSAAANSGDLIDIDALRKKEIANDLAGLFGGARRRKSRKARKSRKSRKHSRK